ncbi:MAG: amidase family protein, partial [Limibacillus sp.]
GRVERINEMNRGGPDAPAPQVGEEVTAYVQKAGDGLKLTMAVKLKDAGREALTAAYAITRYTTFFNMTGHPAMTLPSGLHGTGLPMGVQLVARHFDEALLFRLASCIESAPEFALPPPNL